ncbi:MAG TPA: hypothetical protein VFQ39_10945, partial [Longimicrobium sp.]|nr:hypothetical protein [Longimicrobium sp.]
MDRFELVRTVLLVLGGAFVGAALVFFAHGFWMVRYERRNAVRVERARRALLDLAAAGRLNKADAVALRTLPRRLQVRLFVELASYLAGSQRRYLAAVARDVGLVDAAERMCASRWWWVRLRGVRLLTVIGGGRETVPAMLADRHPAVRAEAVEWAGEHAEDGEIDRLVALLADPGRVGRYELLDSLLRL